MGRHYTPLLLASGASSHPESEGSLAGFELTCAEGVAIATDRYAVAYQTAVEAAATG